MSCAHTHRVASWAPPSAGLLCHDGVGFPQLAHVPGEGPGLQLPHKHRGASLHWLTAIIWLGVVMSVPVSSLLHCKIRQREFNTSGLRTIPQSLLDYHKYITSVAHHCLLIITVQLNRHTEKPLKPAPASI